MTEGPSLRYQPRIPATPSHRTYNPKRIPWLADAEIMHVLKVVWLFLAATPCLIRGLMGGKPSNSRTKLLQTILLDQRQTVHEDTVDKRGYSLIRRKPGFTDECCPSVKESVSLRGGVSRDRKLLELYRDHKTQQRFYQTRCLAGVANKPCRFLNPSDVSSKCVQQHTYMYAIVKDYKIDEPYRLDYIRVKSGCACVTNQLRRSQKSLIKGLVKGLDKEG